MPQSRHRKPAPPAPVGTECSRGAAIGAANGIILALLGGATPAVTVMAAAGASAVGALIALLLWSASAAAPEDRVLPPRDKR
ncbi:MAG: hypothetical protein ACM3Y9_14050 [Ignavibacteria bacterium]